MPPPQVAKYRKSTVGIAKVGRWQLPQGILES